MCYILVSCRQLGLYAHFNCKSSSVTNLIRDFCSKTKQKRYKINIKKQQKMVFLHTRKKINDATNTFFFGPLISSSATKADDFVPEPELEYQNYEINKSPIITSVNQTECFKSIYVEKQHDFDKIIEVDNSYYLNVPRQLNIDDLETFKLFNFQDDYGICNQTIESGYIPEENYIGLPSVTTIINETISPIRKEILKKWEKKKIKELGEAEFAKYRQGLFDRGTSFHECIEMFLRNQSNPTESQLSRIRDTWSSLKHVLKDVSQVRCIERRVVHPHLHYHGVLDCVARYKNTVAVFEFKTSSRPKLTLKSTYDDPLQLMAYLGALSFDPEFKLSEIKQALLVVAYPTGLPAHAHLLTEDDCFRYWKLWCRRLAEFWKKRSINNTN